MVEMEHIQNRFAGMIDGVPVFHSTSYINEIGGAFGTATIAHLNGLIVPVIIIDDQFDLDDNNLLIQFIISHELGHIKLGHLDINNRKEEYYVSDTIYHDPEYEHQADLFGIQRLIDLYGKRCVKKYFAEKYSFFKNNLEKIKIENKLLSENDDECFKIAIRVLKRGKDAIRECH